MRFLPISFISVLLAPALVLADFMEDVHYISTECLPAHHYEAIKGSLLVFAKRNKLSDDEMAARLLYIADPANGITNLSKVSLARRAIGGIFFSRTPFRHCPC